MVDDFSPFWYTFIRLHLLLNCGISLMAERKISNLSAGVRFPYPALIRQAHHFGETDETKSR